MIVYEESVFNQIFTISWTSVINTFYNSCLWELIHWLCS